MSLNLPAVFIFIFIIFCVTIVHFRFMALAPLFSRSTQYLFDFRFLGMTYSTAHAKLTTVSRDASRFSRDESRFSRVHCKYGTNASHSANVKCIQNYRMPIYSFGEIRAYDARLNKPNDRTLFHREIEDCESLVFLKRFFNVLFALAKCL